MEKALAAPTSNAIVTDMYADEVPDSDLGVDRIADDDLYSAIKEDYSSLVSQAGSKAGNKVPAANASTELPVFALLIGINDYEDPLVSNLRGAVPDAQDMYKFLTESLRVPPLHIHTLYNEQATRAAIIASFKLLAKNPRIQPGDTIIIFYSGHGAQTKAPKDWEVSWPDGKIEMILPCNFASTTNTEEDHQGILDLHLAELLSELARKKGDNITVIFDCCHSGSGTKDIEDPRARNVRLDDYKIAPSVVARHGKQHVDGYRFSESHVLLAACSRNEFAWECSGHGIFSTALLKVLRSQIQPDLTYGILTYGELVKMLCLTLACQEPQCEGQNSDRVLFQSYAPSHDRVLHPVEFSPTDSERDGYAATLCAGEIHGVTTGTKFDVFAAPDCKKPQLCRLVATTASACSTVMAFRGPIEQGLPLRAWARRKRTVPEVMRPTGPRFDNLKRAVDRNHSIQFVDSDQPHELRLQASRRRAFFLITDKISTDNGLLKLGASVPRSNTVWISAVAESAANFFFHLRRTNPNAPLKGVVNLQVLQLAYKLIHHKYHLAPCSENLVVNGEVHLTITEGSSASPSPYGFKLTNNDDVELYVWAFIFNVSDFSIDTLYKPNVAAKKADPSLPGTGQLTIGYGAGGGKARIFTLKGSSVDVTYLKIFVTSVYVDLSHIAQPSPFESDPGQPKKAEEFVSPPPPVPPVWDTFLVPIVQKARGYRS